MVQDGCDGPIRVCEYGDAVGTLVEMAVKKGGHLGG